MRNINCVNDLEFAKSCKIQRKSNFLEFGSFLTGGVGK